MANFEIAPMSSSIIMVVGVGGGGSNAVNHMYKLGITDVSFMVCNTDRQALERSPIPNKIRLGDSLTGGLGAGNKPERGRQAAMESIEEIKAAFTENNIKMVFVTAGMGGGTGTGAAPVIAKVAKEMGILTVAIVTIPFKTEGRRRIEQAISGIEEIGQCVDSLLVIDNENIHEIHGDLTLSEAFDKADDILATAAKSIAEIITTHYKVNVDFEDVRTVMQDSGVALMGSAVGNGQNRALEVAEMAMSSPLLNHKDISGAQNVLLNITSGDKEVTLSETYQITEYIQERAGNNNGTDLIWGAGQDETLEDNIRVTVIATGFGFDSIPALKKRYSATLGAAASHNNVRGNNVGHSGSAGMYSGGGNVGGGYQEYNGARQGVQAYSRDVIDLDQPSTPKPEQKRDVSAVDEFNVVIRDQSYHQTHAVHEVYDQTRVERRHGVSNLAEYMRMKGMVAQDEVSNEGDDIHEVASSGEVISHAEVVTEVFTDESVVSTTGSSVIMEGLVNAQQKDVALLTDDEIDIPAWLRRGRKIENSPRDGAKVVHENLDSEMGKNSKVHPKVHDLFE